MQNIKTKTGTLSIAYMSKIGILSAIAMVLHTLSFPLFFAPGFYKLDFSEVAVLLGGFALGPMAAVIIEFLKVLINLLLTGTQTAGIGDIANFAVGLSFVLPAVFIYRHKKSLKSAVIGMSVGTVAFCVFGGFMNAFLLLPVYANVFGMPLEALIGMGTKINPSISNLQTFILLAVTPFNLLKGVLSSLITLILYKRISPVLHKEKFATQKSKSQQ